MKYFRLPIPRAFLFMTTFLLLASAVSAQETSVATATVSPTGTPAEALLPLSPESFLPPFREKLQPAYFPSYVEKSYAKFKDGQFDAVIAEVEKYEQEETFSKRRPFPERALLLKALALIAQGKLAEAEISLKSATTLKGSNAEVAYLLGIVYAAKPDFKLARQAFDETAWFGKGTIASPDLAHVALGLVYHREKNTVKALASFNTALALNPALIQARLEIASVSLETGDKPQAILQLRQVLASNPTSFQAKVYLARALLVNADRLLNRKEIAEAKQIMSEVLKPKELSKDQYLEALPVFVQAQLASGDFEAAEKVVSAALKRDPQSSVIMQLKDQIDLERQAVG